MRLYPWSWKRSFNPSTQTYYYTVIYEADMKGALTAEALAGEPEAELALVRELTEGLINHIGLEMEAHRADTPHPVDTTPDA